MNTQTSLVAEQIRLQQWADQIRDCQNRPSDMKVDAWCREHGITKANYYYRLRRVREACLGLCGMHCFSGKGCSEFPKKVHYASEYSFESLCN